MPRFYQGLDVLVVPSRVEGIPMPPLEALACGTRIVIPRNVGILDELGDCTGVYRYPKGDLKGLIKAVEQAAFPEKPVNREALRALTAPYSVEAWCRDNARAVAQMLEGGRR
jgi:glycosyltransferase involved in cell wall biosynthesis